MLAINFQAWALGVSAGVGDGERPPGCAQPERPCGDTRLGVIIFVGKYPKMIG